MKEVLHNPRLPEPAEVLAINPLALMLDGVEIVAAGKAQGFWTATPEFRLGDSPVLMPVVAAEIFNQLAGYTAAHGQTEEKIPYLTGAHATRWRNIILVGETIKVEVYTDVDPLNESNYSARGQLIREDGAVACVGNITGTLFGSNNLHLLTGESPQQRKPKPPRTDVVKSDHEFYQRLVPLETIRQTLPTGDLAPVQFDALDDNTIILDGKELPVVGHRLFILNALLKNFGRDLTRKDIEKMGFGESISSNSARQQQFSISKNHLMNHLNNGSNKDIFRQRRLDGPTQHMQINPDYSYSFYDHRSDRSS